MPGAAPIPEGGQNLHISSDFANKFQQARRSAEGSSTKISKTVTRAVDEISLMHNASPESYRAKQLGDSSPLIKSQASRVEDTAEALTHKSGGGLETLNRALDNLTPQGINHGDAELLNEINDKLISSMERAGIKTKASGKLKQMKQAHDKIDDLLTRRESMRQNKNDTRLAETTGEHANRSGSSKDAMVRTNPTRLKETGTYSTIPSKNNHQQLPSALEGSSGKTGLQRNDATTNLLRGSDPSTSLQSNKLQSEMLRATEKVTYSTLPADKVHYSKLPSAEEPSNNFAMLKEMMTPEVYKQTLNNVGNNNRAEIAEKLESMGFNDFTEMEMSAKLSEVSNQPHPQQQTINEVRELKQELKLIDKELNQQTPTEKPQSGAEGKTALSSKEEVVRSAEMRAIRAGVVSILNAKDPIQREVRIENTINTIKNCTDLNTLNSTKKEIEGFKDHLPQEIFKTVDRSIMILIADQAADEI